MDLSKEAQLARATSRSRRICPDTGRSRKDCACWPCRNSRNSRKGKAGQRQARTALRLNPERFKNREANEESWRARVRVEVKTGAQVGPIATRYVAARNQSDAHRAIGDLRPFVFAAVPDGSDELLIIAKRDLYAVIEALVEEWGGTA